MQNQIMKHILGMKFKIKKFFSLCANLASIMQQKFMKAFINLFLHIYEKTLIRSLRLLSALFVRSARINLHFHRWCRMNEAKIIQLNLKIGPNMTFISLSTRLHNVLNFTIWFNETKVAAIFPNISDTHACVCRVFRC